jgi:hypothetical protein
VAFSVRRLGEDPAAGDQTADVQFPWKRSRRSRLACLLFLSIHQRLWRAAWSRRAPD